MLCVPLGGSDGLFALCYVTLGFEFVLIVASFFPLTRIPATALLVLLALGRGETGEAALAAAMLPLGPLARLAPAIKAVRAVNRARRVIKISDESIKAYRAAAKALLEGHKAPEIMKLIRQARPVTTEFESNAAIKAAERYRKVLAETHDAKKAADAGGGVYHETVYAAGARSGPDFMYSKPGKLVIGR